MTSGKRLFSALAITAGLGAAAVAVYLVAFGGRLSAGPVDIVWDRELCAHCKMHIGEPAFAAQLQTRSGAVHNFDDPGCMVLFEAKAKPAVHARYFRDVGGAGWMREAEASFSAVKRSPMGFGFGAVRAGSKDAIAITDLRRRIHEKENE